MSEPTARKYRRKAKLPSQLRKEHDWRTRPDPFTEDMAGNRIVNKTRFWPTSKDHFEELQRRYPDQFVQGQLRNFKRRFRDWRAFNGPDKEVFFPQVHIPGEQLPI